MVNVAVLIALKEPAVAATMNAYRGNKLETVVKSPVNNPVGPIDKSIRVGP